MATFIPDTSNTLFQLAADLVNQSGRNLFLTGKAGTGKTTFLKYIRENCAKQMAIVAPTGVAAINAGGVTIHSFFQLPFSPFIPAMQGAGFRQANDATVNPHSLVSRLRFNHDKRKVLQQLELLIIDEISMVRCDMLDAIDTVLRHFRKRPYERFGGVQLLFIGDMFQLPPVIKDVEWKMLNEYYNSPYFFDSLVLKEEAPLYIEFDKIYRQSEERFIRVLNQVRNNDMDAYGMEILESRYQPIFRRKKDDGYIVLTTHNEQARALNVDELQKITNPVFQFAAEIKDDFPQNAYPADELLYVKEGAQVMFIKNDAADKGKRYFNGKIGTVTKIAEEKIHVRCADEPADIEVTKEEWKNIRYSVDITSQSMKEDVLGTFSQFPLRLAWAITIHKSQGLTFEKAIIDAGEAFAPGQVYVALSRCTSLDGLVLKSKLNPSRLTTDQRIVQFSQNISSSLRLQQELEDAKRQYQLQLLTSSFDFRLAIENATLLNNYIKQHSISFNEETITWLEAVQEKLHEIQSTAIKFHQWLNGQFALPNTPQENTALQERTLKAALHFTVEINTVVNQMMQSPAVTDSKLHAKEFNDGLKNVFAELAATRHLLQGFSGQFDTAAWHKRRQNFILPAFAVNAYATASQAKTNSPHPALLMQLKKLRDEICDRRGTPIYLVASSGTLNELARYLPHNLSELRKISGFGDAKVQQYGQKFIDIILAYCDDKNLTSQINEKDPKRERKVADEGQTGGEKKKKGQTQAESLRLFKEGKTLVEIAKERSLTVSTIESHMTRYVKFGDVKIDELVSQDKFVLIEEALKDFDGTSVVSIKNELGNTISFGEIKLVMASLGIEVKKE